MAFLVSRGLTNDTCDACGKSGTGVNNIIQIEHRSRAEGRNIIFVHESCLGKHIRKLAVSSPFLPVPIED